MRVSCDKSYDRIMFVIIIKTKLYLQKYKDNFKYVKSIPYLYVILNTLMSTVEYEP